MSAQFTTPERYPGIQAMFDRLDGKSRDGATDLDRELSHWIIMTYGPSEILTTEDGGALFLYRLPDDANSYLSSRLKGISAEPPVPLDSQVSPILKEVQRKMKIAAQTDQPPSSGEDARADSPKAV